MPLVQLPLSLKRQTVDEFDVVFANTMFSFFKTAIIFKKKFKNKMQNYPYGININYDGDSLTLEQYLNMARILIASDYRCALIGNSLIGKRMHDSYNSFCPTDFMTINSKISSDEQFFTTKSVLDDENDKNIVLTASSKVKSDYDFGVLSLDIKNGFCSEENIMSSYDYLVNSEKIEKEISVVYRLKKEIDYYKDMPDKNIYGRVFTAEEKLLIPGYIAKLQAQLDEIEGYFKLKEETIEKLKQIYMDKFGKELVSNGRKK